MAIRVIRGSRRSRSRRNSSSIAAIRDLTENGITGVDEGVAMEGSGCVTTGEWFLMWLVCTASGWSIAFATALAGAPENAPLRMGVDGVVETAGGSIGGDGIGFGRAGSRNIQRAASKSVSIGCGRKG